MQSQNFLITVCINPVLKLSTLSFSVSTLCLFFLLFFLIYVVNVDINLPIRLGSVSDDGVARLRCYPGLEHFLPHPGDSHPEATDVTASPHRASFRMGGWSCQGKSWNQRLTRASCMWMDWGNGKREKGGEGFTVVLIVWWVECISRSPPNYVSLTHTYKHRLLGSLIQLPDSAAVALFKRKCEFRMLHTEIHKVENVHAQYVI